MAMTCATVNKALAARGAAERLIKGKGYYYFWEGSAPEWQASSVPVAHISQLSLDEWLAEYESLKAAHEARKG